MPESFNTIINPLKTRNKTNEQQDSSPMYLNLKKTPWSEIIYYTGCTRVWAEIHIRRNQTRQWEPSWTSSRLWLLSAPSKIPAPGLDLSPRMMSCFRSSGHMNAGMELTAQCLSGVVDVLCRPIPSSVTCYKEMMGQDSLRGSSESLFDADLARGREVMGEVWQRTVTSSHYKSQLIPPSSISQFILSGALKGYAVNHQSNAVMLLETPGSSRPGELLSLTSLEVSFVLS